MMSSNEDAVTAHETVATNQPTSSSSTAAVASTAVTSSTIVSSAAPGPSTASSSTTPTVRVQRSFKSSSSNRWVAREIAALEFLLEIPLQAEGTIVQEGWLKQVQRQNELDTHLKGRQRKTNSDAGDNLLMFLSSSATSGTNKSVPTLTRQGRWWEKWITPELQQQVQQNKPQNLNSEDIMDDRDSRIEDLEGPEEQDATGNNETTKAVAADSSVHTQQHNNNNNNTQNPVPATLVHAPGRRLEGDDAIQVQVPLSVSVQQTRQRTIARLAAMREWELQLAHGITPNARPAQQTKPKPPLLDGRLFMSAKESYPVQVFSLIRYEPKREEAARRRQKLEERGGGGTQFFILPSRDWRGISYRALLPIKEHQHRINFRPTRLDDSGRGSSSKLELSNHKKKELNPAILFDRFASKLTEGSKMSSDDNLSGTPKIYNDDIDDDTDEETVSSDEDDDPYVAGLLDDPNMKLGRHRNVMIGDRATGPIVSSTIQFVKPHLLKAELNQQFRDRFDGYEPPETQRKFIGARVIDGVYTLIDPTEDNNTALGSANMEDDSTLGTNVTSPTNGTTIVPLNPLRKRQGSTSSYSSTNGADGGLNDGQDTIRMPPSLTLSKIRSLKEQALRAAINAKLEISTVALAVVYFERLCLDCRVDKSNRRLSFAACLLIAVKINEDLKALGNEQEVSATQSPLSSKKQPRSTANRFQSLIRPTKKVDSLFASLFSFFTQDWNISLKHLFAAEWGVFAALQFRLSAKPSHVAFHFKLMIKSLGYDPVRYLGVQMYGYWQDALVEEDYDRQDREERRQRQRRRKEEKKLRQLERELEAANRKEKSRSSAIHPDAITAMDKAKNQIVLKTGNANAEKQGESSTSKKQSSRHGLGDIFKLPIGGVGSKRTQSIERQRKPVHETLTGRATLEQHGTNDNLHSTKVISPELRPLSKSVSMFARTSLEVDLTGTNLAAEIEAGRSSGKDDDEDAKSTLSADVIAI
ncbi:cyclin-like protein [Nitzschia inconspicua]|uniref:Cyclin-like protein n=1 Tax=Nitzschia inconspicua TaxID=303405 RepID=A0A9K3PZU4_9STRA|nr:cyclin-like protein [Nitzschia inconspicua]